MFKPLYTFLFLMIISSLLMAQTDQLTRPGTGESFRNDPIQAIPSEGVIFMDNFNGDNSIAGLNARGWVTLNEDGGGTTDAWFQPSATPPFPAYEGGTSAYVASNFQGANGFLINHWLISPEITVNAGDTLSFWHRSPDASSWDDSIYVRYSTTAGITPAAFDVTWGRYKASTAGWARWTGTFNHSGTIRFAIQYYHTDGGPTGTHSNYLGIDYLEVISAGGSVPEFFDDFDSYTAGVRLCTQTTEWETWSGPAGTNEDPFVSSAFSWSSPNSIVIAPNNDVVRKHGSKTTGKWYISFHFYIPAGKSGYFNNMNGFTPNPFVWGMDSYFDVGGTGRLDTTGGGGTGTTNVSFTWAVAQWNQVIVIIDLDAPNRKAEYWIGTNPSNLTQVATWNWTQNGTKPTRLDVTDLFGAAASDEMYVDNFYFGDAMPTIIPVELTSFAASVNAASQVTLNWTTGSEINNLMFEVQRSVGNNEFHTVGYVNGHGTTSEPQQYSYTDASVVSGKYYYRLKQIDFSGAFEYSNVVEIDVQGPLGFDLAQNYPNPFNPSTIIDFSIAEPGMVKLAVYNLLGEEIQVIRNEYMEPGFHQVTFNALNLPSGMYIYKLETASYTQARKMMLMK